MKLNDAPQARQTPSALVAGWVDLDTATDDQQFAVDRSDSGRTELSAAGVWISLDSAASHWHEAGGQLVIVLGNPTIRERRVRAIDLARQIGGSGDLPSVGGRFAMLLVDRRSKVVCLRTDRFGVWPLCWSKEGSRVAFSDRADCVPLAGRRILDPQSLFNYVYFHMIPAPRTVFRGVSRLEPAREIRLHSAGQTLTSTWEPCFSRHRTASLKDLSGRFLETVRRAITDEADSERVGCFLSGGTDSSTVAGMLKEATGSAECFSIGFDEPGYDEMEYARIAAKHFGARHHQHYVTPTELVDAIPSVARSYDQPFGNSSAVPAFICSRLARESGLLKLLAGDGGDELFGGNSRYAKQKVFEAWWSFPAPIRQVVSPMVANRFTRRTPLLRKAASYIDQARVPMPARLETYNLLGRMGPTSVFSSDFLQLVDTSEPSEQQARVYGEHTGAPFIDRMLAYDWRFTLSDNDLPKVRGTTSLAGIEAGFPFLADSLVDLSTQLQPSDKVHGLKLRYFFKKSLSGFLPPEIIAKKKQGFGLPVGRWLVSDRAFRDMAHDSLSALAARGLIVEQLVDDLFSRRLGEHAGYHGEMAWVLMMMEHWLSEHQPDSSFS